MNVIFLDVDYVLTSTNYAQKLYKETGIPRSNYDYPMDPECLENFCELVIKTDAKVIVTSTWRKEKEGRDRLQEILKTCGLENRVIGYTPILNTFRGIEIKEALKTLEQPVRFIILDDDSDMVGLEDHLIQTNMKTGFTKEHLKEAIEKFEKTSYQKSFSFKNT